ncbi:MAG: HIT family protein [Candidatus Woesearchaeota archaeon]|nr:HIT family protein [Candidatus Woesearchaeota archaeon]
MQDCIFCKIIKGEIPSSKVYEDKHVFAFLDIAPVNKGHVLVVPKNHSLDFSDMADEDIKAVFVAAKKIANAVMKGTGAQGYNLGMNNKKAAGQLVMHSHLHIIPRFDDDGLKHWPAKKYTEGEAEKVKDVIIKQISI